MIVSKMFI